MTLVAVIGAYFAADGLHASGFMAVFVFGIVLGNKEAFGFRMEEGEAQKLDEFVLTTAFIMRLFIFILLGAQVDFALMQPILARRHRRRHRADAGGAAGNGLSCAHGPTAARAGVLPKCCSCAGRARPA